MENTRSMNMDPQPVEEFHAMDSPRDSRFQLLPVMSGDMFLQTINYPIVVEMWGKKNFGRNKRRWLSEFTEPERDKISRYHERFYRWHLISGTPKQVSCRLGTLDLLIRAVDFFASL